MEVFYGFLENFDDNHLFKLYGRIRIRQNNLDPDRSEGGW